MKKTKAILIFVLFLFVTAGVVHCGVKKDFSLSQVLVSKDLSNIELTLDKPKCNIKTTMLVDNRLIIDLNDCVNRVIQKQIYVNKGCIKETRNAQYKQKPLIARVVIVFNKKIKYCISRNGNNIFINIINSNDGDTVSNKKSSNINIHNINQQQSKFCKITYLNNGNSVFSIPEMNVLKYTLHSNILTFQLSSKYDYNDILKIKDKNIKKLQIIRGTAFNTYIIVLNQTEPVTVKPNNGNINLTIGKTPQVNTKRIVVIDAGHGGPEPGASGNGIIEKNLNLEIALKVKNILLKNKITVYMTRDKDEYLNKSTKSVTEELISRAQYANSVNADFLVSIHTNAASPSAYGVETIFYPDNGQVKKTLKKGKVNSKELAEFVQNSIIDKTGAYNRKIVSNPKLIILKYTDVVPCLVEVGFLTNSKEASLLKTDNYTDKMAQGIADGIIEAYNNN